MCALDFELAPPKEIAIVGLSTLLRSAQDDTEKLLAVVFGEYRPNQVVAWKRADGDSAVPLLEGRAIMDSKATAYVCENFACQMPVTAAEALAAQFL